MSASLFGQEIEFALTARNASGCLLPGEDALNLLFSGATEFPHLRDSGNGLFLANGSRFYRETGDHPEFATPETTNPWDTVRYVRAGEVFVSRLAKSARERYGLREMRAFKHNVNYGRDGGITWGTHESFNLPLSSFSGDLSRARREVKKSLISFLVSRIIFTGSGGFNSMAPGIEFLLSPRAAHLTCEVSDSSTHARPILHIRDESLSHSRLNFGRLHLICGESNLGDLSLWLKFATTALTLAMLSAGVPLPEIRLRDPVGAMRRFSGDPTMKKNALLATGGRVGALEIQKRFLLAAESSIGHPALPPWAEEVCRRWRAALDELEERSTSGALLEPERIDWRIKYSLFTEVIRMHGFTWQGLEPWNGIARFIRRKLARLTPGAPPYLNADLISRNVDPNLKIAMTEAGPTLARACLRWQDFASFLRLRDVLQALDVKLMEVGDESLFARLDQTGAFAHRVKGVDDIEHAIETPPFGSRATLRGGMVRRLHGRNPENRFICGWQEITDRKNQRILDLGDPFETKLRWLPATGRPDSFSSLFLTRPDRSSPLCFPFGEILNCYDLGDYRRGWRILEDFRQRFTSGVSSATHHSLPGEFYQHQAWFAARQGFLEETFVALERFRAHYPDPSGSFFVSSNHVLALLNVGLGGDDSIDEWIERGNRTIDSQGSPSVNSAFLSNAACRRLRMGDSVQARIWLDRALQPALFNSAHAHTQARLLAHMGECCRRSGRFDEAAEWLRRSEELYLRHGFLGDYADYCLVYQAKLALSREESGVAADFLEKGCGIQDDLGNPGVVRSLLLLARARGDDDPVVRERIGRRADGFPSFKSCHLLQRILDTDHWPLWCRSHSADWTSHVV